MLRNNLERNLALGLGSTSCLGNKHYQRPSKMSDYIDFVNSLFLPSSAQDSTIRLPPWFPSQWLGNHTNVKASVQENEDTLTNIIMTRLRTSDGLDLDWISTHYGEDIATSIHRSVNLAIELNLAEIVHVGNDQTMRHGILRLVDPEGFLFSNTILSYIFAELGFVG
jgi:oxygen-independent coproporphyrinogen-3 oxidase